MNETPPVIATTAAGKLLADGTTVPHPPLDHANSARVPRSVSERVAGPLQREMRYAGVMRELAQTEVEQLAAENAFLQSRVVVERRAVQRGDLTRNQCQTLRAEYQADAEKAQARADSYGRLAADLADGQTVRQLWLVGQARLRQGPR